MTDMQIKNITLALIAFMTALHAIDLKCDFGKELPKEITTTCPIVDDGGERILNCEKYVAAVIRFEGEGSAEGVLEMEIMTTGQPPSQLGVILYVHEDGKLQRLQTLAWLKNVPRDSFDKMNFVFPTGTFKSGKLYDIYLYRANSKGQLKLRSISFRTKAVGKTITLNYKNTPDLVGPLTHGPSGKPDFHIHLTGLDPQKSIKEIVVTRQGGRWVSGDDVKKNFWMIEYYDSADFAVARNPRNNFDGKLHSGLSCIDLVMEGGYAEGSEYLCEVFYSDGTKDSWKAEIERPERPAVPMEFNSSKNILVNADYRIPDGWRQPVIGGKTYFQILSEKDKLSQGLIMKGNTHHRVWSLGWFLPFSGLNPKPSKSQIEKHSPMTYRAALREFQVFDANRKEISRDAKITASEGLQWQNLENAIDGDTGLDSAAKVAKPEVNKPQYAEVTLTFAQPTALSKVVLHHGCRNGNQPGWIASEFALDSLKNGKWEALDGTKVVNNENPTTEHSLDGIVTSGLRFRIISQKPLCDYSLFDWSVGNDFLDLAKTDDIPADNTFHYWYLGHDTFIYFSLPGGNYVAPGREQFQQWYSKHPNFMGFQLTEFDNDLQAMLGWGSYRDQKTAKAVYEGASKRLVVHRDIPKLPETRAMAVKQYEEAFNLYQRMMFNACANFSSMTIWHHQPMEWGAISTVMECFGGCPVFSMQVASARGASRQYGNKPWGCYHATYLGSGYVNYINPNGKTSGPNCGKSPSLYRRQLYYTYLSGCTYTDYEHPDIAFVKTKFVSGQEPDLSPHGKVVLETAEFARHDTERGDLYTPIALLFDWEHGWDNHESRKVWLGMFKPTLGDRNIDAWMKGVFGNSELPQEGYGCNMSQTGFSGLADILVLNPPSGPARNLEDYPAAIIAGDHKWNDRTVAAVKKYVANGGCLILTSEQLPQNIGSEFTGLDFTGKSNYGTEILIAEDKKSLTGAKQKYQYSGVVLKGASALLCTPAGEPLVTAFPFGKGKVVLCLQKYLVEEPDTASQKNGLATIHYILSLLRHELLPFKVTGDSPAELLCSRLKSGWRVSLINNRGVYKQEYTAAVVVPSEKTTQTIVYKGNIKSAIERITGRKLKVDRANGESRVSVVIPPGDLAVVDVMFE